MQIKLVPSSLLPTVLFTVTYSEPPDYLGFPASWAQTLHRISADDLELPSTMHAFDKTTWLVTILHSVTFDLASKTVLCTFVDGKTQLWPLSEEDPQGKCFQELESVLKDVNNSAIEAEREKRRTDIPRPSPSPCPSHTKSEPILHSQSQSTKQGKHKKQRSLLMSLVACVNRLRPRPRFRPVSSDASRRRSLVSPRTSSFSHSSPYPQSPSRTPSPPLSDSNLPESIMSSDHESVSGPQEPGMTSTALRRRARSTLVNAFRRYVLMKLSGQTLPGGYPAWIARSMLGRVEGEMSQMVKEAGGAPDMDPTMAGIRTGSKAGSVGRSSGAALSMGLSDVTTSPTLVDEPPPFFEEDEPEGDHDSTSTDTDGSSVHTPDSVSFDGSTFFPDPLPAPSSPLSSKRQHRRETMFSVPSSPSPSTSPVRPSFSPCNLAAYTALSGQRLRLRSVLTRIDAQLATVAHDDERLQCVLEIKSRRRAWSNRQFMGGAQLRHGGLSTPVRSSPLATCEPINASDLVEGRSSSASEGVAGTPNGKPKRGLVVTTAEHNIMRLFPVCEEEEDEDEPAPPCRDIVRTSCERLVVESIIPPSIPSVRLVETPAQNDTESNVLPLQLQRHAVPIRSRTRSMMQAQPVSVPVLSPTSFSHPCELENEKLGMSVLEPQTKVELFDAYTSEDEDDDEHVLGVRGIGLTNSGNAHSEFTLAMDLPQPYTMTVGGKHEWITVANTSIPSR
ncbi:hypothetical protein PHLCEN_2v9282 [Hermanssonia centrifuga]|uniref:Uncharacterized protein n=1 Tax=Hermanssonia centrifuga TaxID=98765 RepID=A0A2R6NRA2_9APHY|nr:hypothetical protein PHLCEN_2v9282 [Hermanssonia centrifuga]